MAQELTDTGSDWGRLIDAARRGDELALGELYERLSGYLWLTADRGLADDLRAKVAASDVVQQTLIEAHQGFGTFEGNSGDDLKKWLSQILRNNLTDAARRYRGTKSRDMAREQSLGVDGSTHRIRSNDLTPSAHVRRGETDEELLRAVASLPERRRRVIEMRHHEGCSYAEIGAALEISEVAARKLWSRSVEQLRSKLCVADDDRPSQPR